MNYALLLNASVAIQIHFLCAVAALLLGMMQLFRKKGTRSHKALGSVWVVMMVIICASSFWIKELMPNSFFWGLSPIHLLSIYVIFKVVQGVYFAKTERVVQHEKCMRAAFFSGLVVAGFFTFYPNRMRYKMVF